MLNVVLGILLAIERGALDVHVLLMLVYNCLQAGLLIAFSRTHRVLCIEVDVANDRSVLRHPIGQIYFGKERWSDVVVRSSRVWVNPHH